MIEYRKHKSGREFARIDGSLVKLVLIKLESCSIHEINSAITAEDILTDEVMFLPSTEQEFKEALQVALERINKMKIV